MAYPPASRGVIDYGDDMKPLGVFGAPACRCTATLVALCVSLSGMVLIGIGGCIAVFMNHTGAGIYVIFGYVLVALGVGLILAGIAFYFYDQYAPGGARARHAQHNRYQANTPALNPPTNQPRVNSAPYPSAPAQVAPTAPVAPVSQPVRQPPADPNPPSYDSIAPPRPAPQQQRQPQPQRPPPQQPRVPAQQPPAPQPRAQQPRPQPQGGAPASGTSAAHQQRYQQAQSQVHTTSV